MPTVIDMVGRRCGSLTVTSFHSINSKHKHNRQAHWDCLCDCGKATVVSGSNLRNGTTKTCGCGIGRIFATGARTSETRHCRKCKMEKSIREFRSVSLENPERRSWLCSECRKKDVSQYPCVARQRQKAHDRKKAARALALKHYGGRCNCCGETEEVFLAFDHINGGGSQHRSHPDRKRFVAMGVFLVETGFPEGYQILCNNCNWAKHA